MIRWLRVVISPSRLVGGLVFGWFPYLVMLGLAWSLLKQSPDDDMKRAGPLALGVVAVAYAVYRVAAFHPHVRPDYRDWLARTPWSPDQPLPDGPVLLAPQDLVVFAVLGIPAWLVYGADAWPLVPAFAITYLVMLAVILLETGQRVVSYVIGFGIIAMAGLMHVHAAAFALAMITYGAAAIGYRRSLHAFPWLPDAEQLARKRAAEARRLGWPFDTFLPFAVPPIIRKWEGPVLALLVAGIVFVAGYQHYRLTPPAARSVVEGPTVLVPFLVITAAFIRVVVYMYGHLPPISLAGRLATGRLLIPEYDIVFVAPLLACAVMLASLIWLPLIGLPEYVVMTVGAGLALPILSLVGPDRARWQLTAPARLVPLLKRPEKPRPLLPPRVTGR